MTSFTKFVSVGRIAAAIVLGTAGISGATALDSEAAKSETEAAAQSGVMTAKISKYQNTRPGEFRFRLEDGSLWVRDGGRRGPVRFAGEETSTVTMTPKGNSWIMQVEGSKRKYKVKRVD